MSNPDSYFLTAFSLSLNSFNFEPQQLSAKDVIFPLKHCHICPLYFSFSNFPSVSFLCLCFLIEAERIFIFNTDIIAFAAPWWKPCSTTHSLTHFFVKFNQSRNIAESSFRTSLNLIISLGDAFRKHPQLSLSFFQIYAPLIFIWWFSPDPAEPPLLSPSPDVLPGCSLPLFPGSSSARSFRIVRKLSALSFKLPYLYSNYHPPLSLRPKRRKR